MNNALFQELEESPKVDNSEKRAELVKLIEAIAGLLENRDWQVLHESHFSKEKDRIHRLLLQASQREEVSEKEIYRLQGEFIWANRYADLSKFALILKKQLENL